MELWVGAVVLGLLYALMTTGVYLTYRVYNFADITVDGSFTAGGAAAAALIVAGFDPVLALVAALAVGAASGAATALIHTRFKINGLLSGILVMTGLYSVNLHLMGRSNIPLLQHPTLFSALESLNPGLPGPVWTALALILALAGFWLLMAGFLKTDLGLAMRATGENPRMAAANGRDVNRLIILGLALANGLVGVSGGLVAQYQGFADVTMGVGTIVVGLASVIIGESALRSRSLTVQVLSVVLGSVIFRLMIALALYLGLNPIDLKLLTAVFVLLTLVLSQRMGKGRAGLPGLTRLLRPAWAWGLAAAILAGLGWWAAQPPGPQSGGQAASPVRPLIGVVQFTDNGVLDLTRQGLVQELRKLGHVDGQTCRLDLENAHGDQATLNLILDKFLKDGADLVVTISTPATQAGLKKITDRPLVFATVANPFLIQAGASETEHRANVTGTYGWAPMDQTLDLTRRILPGPLKIGAIWDPSQANAEFNVANLRRALAGQSDLSFHGATVAGTGEVQQAAQSLLNQGVNVLVLPPDNIIYSAFDAVVSVAQAGKTPVVVSDVELLPQGALAALGYDYVSSGEQAARLVDRVLRGENPRDIPFERYSRLSLGINTKVAADLRLTLPPAVLAQATVFHPPAEAQAAARPAPALAAPGPAKRLAIFLFTDMPIVLDALRGVQDELAQSAVARELGLEVSVRSAQGEMALGQAIAQDLVRQRFDYIVSLSTIALQLAARFNKTIPQVFGAVTDPYLTGVARSPGDHQPNITGVATFQPVEAVLRAAREVFPHAKRIGLAWNPGELSSEACTKKARELAPGYGFTLVEANVTTTADVMEAVRGILAKDIDLFFTSGDSTTLSAFESVAKLLHQARVPYLSNSCADVNRGALLAVGPDYYNVGRRTGALAIRLMRGESPQAIPIVDYVPETLCINRALAAEYGVVLPPAVANRAANLGDGR
jgi:putative ABC transport system permease protein